MLKRQPSGHGEKKNTLTEDKSPAAFAHPIYRAGQPSHFVTLVHHERSGTPVR